MITTTRIIDVEKEFDDYFTNIELRQVNNFSTQYRHIEASTVQLLITPQETHTMQLSLNPSNNSGIRESAITWLQDILNRPAFSGIYIPENIKGYIYVNNEPRLLKQGGWEINNGTGYIALARNPGLVDNFTKLGILSCIANMTGVMQDPSIIELFSQKLVVCVTEVVRNLHGNIIRSNIPPTRLAIDQANYLVAAELNGSWHLTSGAPVEVTESWIIMDF